MWIIGPKFLFNILITAHPCSYDWKTSVAVNPQPQIPVKWSFNESLSFSNLRISGMWRWSIINHNAASQCLDLPPVFSCIPSHVMYLWLQPVRCTLLYFNSSEYENPLQNTKDQQNLLNSSPSYITAADLLKIYSLLLISSLSCSELTWSSFFMTRPCAKLVPGRYSWSLVFHSVNVKPCVGEYLLLYMCADVSVCLPLFADNGRRDIIRCLHPSSFLSLPLPASTYFTRSPLSH